MKYINVSDLLPPALVQTLQEYVQGGYVYIPAREHKSWGKKSGSREALAQRNEVYEEVCDKVTEYGILTLPKPASKQMVAHTLNFMAGIRERLRKLENKSLSMEEKMKEIRLVNRAKWVLIDELKMSEADAHRYIEKQAMDRCVSRREIAEEIISTYL